MPLVIPLIQISNLRLTWITRQLFIRRVLEIVFHDASHVLSVTGGIRRTVAQRRQLTKIGRFMFQLEWASRGTCWDLSVATRLFTQVNTKRVRPIILYGLETGLRIEEAHSHSTWHIKLLILILIPLIPLASFRLSERVASILRFRRLLKGPLGIL